LDNHYQPDNYKPVSGQLPNYEPVSGQLPITNYQSTMPTPIQSAYNRWSQTYDSQPNPTRDIDAAVLDHILPDLTGLTVIEAGCGTGKNSGRLAACHHLIALDFSEGMMAVARRKVQTPNITWAQCDLNRPWPLSANTADLVIFNLVLEHIQHLEPIFAQAARVLHPGGQMLLSEFHPIRLTDGKGAQITAEDGRILEFIGSFRHTAQEFETAAHSLGLHLLQSQEWIPETKNPGFSPTNKDSQADSQEARVLGEDERPLLLTMRFDKG
jgi:malonyl-CoA O-methyltransferase